jgi:hypothetical protein
VILLIWKSSLTKSTRTAINGCDELPLERHERPVNDDEDREVPNLEASIRKYDFSEDGAAELQAVEVEDVVERALDSGSFETKSVRGVKQASYRCISTNSIRLPQGSSA